jgi:cytochrome c-type biogenesis protein CcmH
MRIILCLLFLTSFAASAQNLSEEELEEQIQSISHELRCPICQGLSVKESMNEISVNMKKKIRKLLLEGQSREQILVFFEERYGEWVLRAPKKTGLNITLWIAPFIAIVLATAFIFYRLKKKYQNNTL